MAIGMPYELFWHGEPKKAKTFRDAHNIRMEQRNQEMWVQGIYNLKAFRSVIEALSYGLSGGKGSKPSQYPDQPIPFTEHEQKMATERNKQRTLAWVKEGQR